MTGGGNGITQFAFIALLFLVVAAAGLLSGDGRELSSASPTEAQGTVATPVPPAPMPSRALVAKPIEIVIAPPVAQAVAAAIVTPVALPVVTTPSPGLDHDRDNVREVRHVPERRPEPVDRTAPEPRQTTESVLDGLPAAIEMSVDYLVQNCRSDGRFSRRIDFEAKTGAKRAYDIIGHTGAMCALSAFDRTRRIHRVRSALARSGQFLKKNYIGSVSGREGMLAAWSRPRLIGAGGPTEAKLGDTGMALAALAGLEHAHSGFTSVEDFRRLGMFIVYMQKADGSFHNKYAPSRGGRCDDRKASYDPSQAALGLLMLYELDPSPIWLQAAADAIGFLARSREGQEPFAADPWTLLATAKLLPMYDHCHPQVARWRIVEHAVGICERMLDDQRGGAGASDIRDSFAIDGRTTPTATQLEGLLAALAYLPEEREELKDRIRSAVRPAMAFLLRTRDFSGEQLGAMPPANERAEGGAAGRVGQTDLGGDEIRFDQVQHALSAMLQYRERFGTTYR